MTTDPVSYIPDSRCRWMAPLRLARGVVVVYSLLLFLFPAQAFPGDVNNTLIKSSISTKEIRVGEKIELLVVAEHDRSIDIFFPDESAKLSPFEVVGHKVSRKNTFSSRPVMEIRYIITSFDDGEFVVPSLLITAKDGFGNEKNVLTDKHKVSVKLAEVKGEEILDIHPPMEIAPVSDFIGEIAGYAPSVAVAVLLIVASLAAVYYLRRRRPTEARNYKLEAITALRSIKMDDGDLQAACFEISTILKSFIGFSLSVDSEKMTSLEISSFLKEKITAEKLHDDVSDLFYDLDLVKFSPFRPSQEDARKALKRAESVIKEMP